VRARCAGEINGFISRAKPRMRDRRSPIAYATLLIAG